MRILLSLGGALNQPHFSFNVHDLELNVQPESDCPYYSPFRLHFLRFILGP